MNKINNNLISFGLIMLAILAFGATSLLPNNVFASNNKVDSSGTYYGYDKDRYSMADPIVDNNSGTTQYNGYKYGQYGAGAIPNMSSGDSATNSATQANPAPIIYSISPDAKDLDSGGTLVTIKGENFIPSSIAKWNSSVRDTIYINSTHLAMKVTKEDLSAGTGEYQITVFNPAPGGGDSNSAIFTVRDIGSTLAGSAILSGFMPISLMGWLILAILLLLAVILWRKLYISDKERNAPLKHA